MEKPELMEESSTPAVVAAAPGATAAMELIAELEEELQKTRAEKESIRKDLEDLLAQPKGGFWGSGEAVSRIHQRRVSGLQTELQGWKQQVADLTRECSELQAEVRECHASKSHVGEKFRAAVERNTALEKEIKFFQAQAASALVERDAATVEAETTRAQKEAWMAELETVKAERDSARAESSGLRSQLRSLEAVRKEFADSAREASSRADAAETSLEAVKNQLRKLQDEVEAGKQAGTKSPDEPGASQQETEGNSQVAERSNSICEDQQPSIPLECHDQEKDILGQADRRNETKGHDKGVEEERFDPDEDTGGMMMLSMRKPTKEFDNSFSFGEPSGSQTRETEDVEELNFVPLGSMHSRGSDPLAHEQPELLQTEAVEQSTELTSHSSLRQSLGSDNSAEVRQLEDEVQALSEQLATLGTEKASLAEELEQVKQGMKVAGEWRSLREAALEKEQAIRLRAESRACSAESALGEANKAIEALKQEVQAAKDKLEGALQEWKREAEGQVKAAEAEGTEMKQMLAQATKEKVETLLLLSQQEERHRLEIKTAEGLREQAATAKQKLHQAIEEKLIAVVEVANLKAEIGRMLEQEKELTFLLQQHRSTSANGRMLPAAWSTPALPHSKSSSALPPPPTSPLTSPPPTPNPQSLEQRKAGSSGGSWYKGWRRKSSGSDSADGTARLQVENAGLLEQVGAVQRVTATIHRLRLTLQEVCSATVEVDRQAMLKTVEAVVSEAQGLRLALGGSLPVPVSWSEQEVGESLQEPGSSAPASAPGVAVDVSGMIGVELAELVLLVGDQVRRHVLGRPESMV